MRKYLISISILMCFSFVNGQLNVLPPSPNASSISRFAENEVSLNNGTVNINIPIHEFTVDGVTVNVNLTYNSKGVMVAEDASDVGLGWTLNAGGVITRQVRGQIDERVEGGYMTFDYVSDFTTNYPLRVNLLQLQEGPIEGNLNYKYDYYPDLYHLTFLGRTTKIIFDNHTKKPVMQSLNDMKIEADLNGNTVQSFRVTDEKGNEYFFGNFLDIHQGTQRVAPNSSGPNDFDLGYPTAWYLNRIKTVNNKNIYFTYSFATVINYSGTYYRTNTGTLESEVYKNNIKQHSISQISFPEGDITFNESSGREDLQGGKRIETIFVNSKPQGIKKIKLNYEYRTGGNTANIHPHLAVVDPNSAKRLFLTSLDYQGFNGSKYSSYSFEYDPILLPSKHSTSIDYWGYYNGFSNGNNLLPFMEQKRREVNITNLQAGVLKKITYPTGGFSQFEYEPNYTNVPVYWNDFYIPEVKNDSNFYNKISTGITKDEFFFVPNPTGPSGVGHYERVFNISGNPTDQVYVSTTAMLGMNCTSIENIDCKTRVRILSQSTGQLWTVTQGNAGLFLTPGFYSLKVINSEFTLADSQDFETNAFSVVLRWKEKKVLPYEFIGGGLRIKSILNSDGIKTTKKTYSYDFGNNNTSGMLLGIPDHFLIAQMLANNAGFCMYTEKIGSTKPIASLNAAGAVSYAKVTENFVENLESKGSNTYIFTNFQDMGEFYRSHAPRILPTDLGYLRGLLLEKQTKNSNGKLLQKLENTYKLDNSYSPIFCYRDWQQQWVCPDPTTVLTPPGTINGIYELTNHYKYSKDAISIPLYMAGSQEGCGPGQNNNSNKYDIYRSSFFINLFYIKNSTKVTKFFENSVISQKTYYNYDHPVHHQITAQHDILSDFSESLTEFSYAHEKDNHYLIGKNMVAIPLETTVIRKKDSLDTGKVISQSLTKYPGTQSEADTKTAGLPLPYEVWSKDLQNTILHKELSYDLYDHKGNIQQYTSKDIPVTIIWGYNDTQPIAKIEGALYDQIKTDALITAIITASNTDASEGTFNSEQALITALDNLRKNANFSGYQIITYTYDPLVGVRSITPPSGIREVYLYDTANRLKEIREESDTGKLLKEYRYNYKH